MRGLRCHCQCQGWGATPRHEPLALPRLSVTGADTEVTSPLPLRGTADLQRAGVESHECRTTMLLLFTSEHQQRYHKRWEQTTKNSWRATSPDLHRAGVDHTNVGPQCPHSTLPNINNDITNVENRLQKTTKNSWRATSPDLHRAAVESRECRTTMLLHYTSEHQQWYHKRHLLSNIHKTNNEPPTICIKEYFKINKRNGRKVQNVCKRIVNFIYNY